MIRINLLAGSTAATPAPTSIDLGQRVTVACSVIVVATIMVIGWRFWSLRQETTELQQELAVADQEISRLRPVVAQVQALDTDRLQLEQRVGVVEGLRSGQSGPVHMLDQVSRAMPDSLWLVRLVQDDDAVVVAGRTLTLGALSDFMAHLEDSAYFEPPVGIIDSQLEETDLGEVVRFELRAAFLIPDD